MKGKKMTKLQLLQQIEILIDNVHSLQKELNECYKKLTRKD